MESTCSYTEHIFLTGGEEHTPTTRASHGSLYIHTAATQISSNSAFANITALRFTNSPFWLVMVKVH